MVSEPRRQSMAWVETDYSKHTYFRLKIKWRLEHVGALGIMGEMIPLNLSLSLCRSSRRWRRLWHRVSTDTTCVYLRTAKLAVERLSLWRCDAGRNLVAFVLSVCLFFSSRFVCVGVAVCLCLFITGCPYVCLSAIFLLLLLLFL